MTLEWKLNRLRTMDAREVGYRVIEASRERLQRIGIGRASPSRAGLAQGHVWIAPLPTQFAIEQYCEAADLVLGGIFRHFALGRCQIGFPPRWNRDPKTGVQAPLTFGRMLNYRDEALVGNIKYLWEFNRHLELVNLAQAWHLSRQDKYADGCRELLESWFDQCPYPLGPNWTSSLEIGIRLLNWSFAWHLLGGEEGPLFADQKGKQFKQRWLNSIFQHCHFISSFPSLHSSANNHVLGEQLGLFVAATTWPKWPESCRWRKQAQDLFHREALLQNASDGVNREQGIWYHHEVADMMLIAALVARANSIQFSKSYWDRLAAMLEFIACVMDVGGNVPAFGDSDDAVMVRFCPSRDFSVFRSLLATGAVLFNRSDFMVKASKFDDKSRWLLGDSAETQFESLSENRAVLPPRRAFPQGGYYILGADFESPREVRIVADAGPLGYLSIAAHGHADALSFTLSAAGQELLIDSGTFAYHTDQKWRDYFRGTSAHNTVRIDGVDQSVSGGTFMWMHHARAKCENFQVLDDRQTLSTSHDGYCRLSDPVVHKRELTFDRNTRTLRVEDEILARGPHRFEIFWHLSEQCIVELKERNAVIQANGIAMELTWPTDAVARIARGEESPPQGWVSRSFDSRRPISTIVISGSTRGSWRGVSEIKISPLAGPDHAL